MRTKNAKRLWPVPVTLGVIALAALLAFGLLAINDAQPVAAQSADPCLSVTFEQTSPVDVAQQDPLNSEAALCEASSAEAIIELTGTVMPDDTTAVYVYGVNVGGGAGVVYAPGTVYNTTDEVFEIDSAEVDPLPVQQIEIVKPTTDGTATVKASKGTVTITGQQLTTTTVYIAYGGRDGGFLGTPNQVAIANEERVTSVLAAGSVLEVTVKFLGAPVTVVPDDFGIPLADKDVDETAEPRSALTATGLDIATLAPGVDEIVVTAEVMDANGDYLSGRITYAVEYVAGSAVESGRRSYTTQPVDYVYGVEAGEGKGHTHEVKGWSSGSGPVKINVTAMFQGGTGSVELKLGTITTEALMTYRMDKAANVTDTPTESVVPGSITRAGDLDRVVVTATCFMDSEADEDQEEICGDKQRPRSIFSPGDSFTIKAKAEDALGTSKGNDAPTSVTFPADALTEAGVSVFTGNLAGVDIDDNAPPGRYMLTVKATERTDDGRIDKEIMVEVIISGEPATYEISCDEYISLAPFASGECVITAKDANGNPPVFDTDEMQDQVTVDLESSLNVRTNLPGTGIVMLKEDGTGKFTVSKPADAEEGDSVAIGIRVGGELQHSTTVMFGEAGVTMPDPGIELGKVSDTSTGPFNEGGVIQVNWASAPNATGYIIYAVNVDELDDPDGQIVVKAVNDAAAMTYNLDGLNVGANYDIYVVATAPAMAEWPEDADVQHVTAN